MSIKRKYLKNGYVLPVPKFENDEDYDYLLQKSCFIDTNKEDNIEYNLGDFEKDVKEEPPKVREEKQIVRKLVKN